MQKLRLKTSHTHFGFFLIKLTLCVTPQIPFSIKQRTDWYLIKLMNGLSSPLYIGWKHADTARHIATAATIHHPVPTTHPPTDHQPTKHPPSIHPRTSHQPQFVTHPLACSALQSGERSLRRTVKNCGRRRQAERTPVGHRSYLVGTMKTKRWYIGQRDTAKMLIPQHSFFTLPDLRCDPPDHLNPGWQWHIARTLNAQ